MRLPLSANEIPELRITNPKHDIGNICFRKAAETLWNNLPLSIRKCTTLATFKMKVDLEQSPYKLCRAKYTLHILLLLLLQNCIRYIYLHTSICAYKHTHAFTQ